MINSLPIAPFTFTWELYGENTLIDLQQALEEGRDVEALRAEAERIARMPRSRTKEAAADIFFEQLCEAPVRADYPYMEPSDLASILAERPAAKSAFGGAAAQASFAKPPVDDVLRDKILGAWRGRVCGCLLGKPVEGMYRDEILKIAEIEGNLPIRTYLGADLSKLKEAGISEKRLERLAMCYRRGYMPPDDDTNYTVMACKEIVGRFGRDFMPEDVARVWLETQPFTAYCTAERVALRNFVDAIAPPYSATYKNPFREWIGAQIRGDSFGYINPGEPETAAEMAFRDASISHIKNGIYGEMLFAAAIAAAAVTDDPEEILKAGLSQIPMRSRLYEDVQTVIDWYHAGVSEDEVLTRIHTRWDETNSHHWCHTNSNAMIVTACLLYGGMDYTKTVGMAVAYGFDTDCNAATLGSLIGMARGSRAIGDDWISAMDDTIHTELVKCQSVKISDMVEATLAAIDAATLEAID